MLIARPDDGKQIDFAIYLELILRILFRSLSAIEMDAACLSFSRAFSRLFPSIIIMILYAIFRSSLDN